MRIVQINDTYGTGSIGRLSKNISDILIKEKNKVLFLYAQGNADKKYCVKISSPLLQKIHALLSRLTGLQGYFSFFSTLKTVKTLREFKPDVVHLHNLHSNYINLKLLGKYLKRDNIGTVITLHDCWMFTGKCTYYIPANCKKWKEGCGKCPLLHKDNVNPTLFFDTTRRCLIDKKKWIAALDNLAIVGVSDWVTNEARQSIYKNKKLYRIYNWIDQDVFFYRKSDLRNKMELVNEKIILMVSSSLSVKKGYHEMLFLAKNLPSEYQLIYIGRNSQNLSIPKNVIHIEHTDDAAQLAEYYSTADVCVNTTLYETFGMVTVESMSCGTPVVVYNNTASPELVSEGCGVIVNQSDGMGKIIEAIEIIVSWDRGKTREKCINYVQQTFNEIDAVKAYMDVYKSFS